MVMAEGDSLLFDFEVKNHDAGHRVPTGDPERFFLVSFEIINENSVVIVSKHYVIGEKWEWYPAAKKIEDNHINPGESRNFQMRRQMNKKGKYVLRTTVTKHRLNAESAAYNGLNQHYPLFIEIYRKEFRFSVR